MNLYGSRSIVLLLGILSFTIAQVCNTLNKRACRKREDCQRKKVNGTTTCVEASSLIPARLTQECATLGRRACKKHEDCQWTRVDGRRTCVDALGPAPPPAPGPTPSPPTPAPPSGGVGTFQWRVQVGTALSSYSLVRPAVNPDGTIYAVDIYNNLMAVNPDGSTKWSVSATGNKGVAFGIDTMGAEKVYTAKAGGKILAHDASNGNLVWEYRTGSLALGIALDVDVGPDGNVYGVFAGPGVASVTDSGTFYTENWVVSEPKNKNSPSVSEVRFGQTTISFYNTYQRFLDIVDGSEVRKTTCCVNTNPVPNANTDTHWTVESGSGTAVVKLNVDGTQECSFQMPTFAGAGEPVEGASGNIYFISQGNKVYSLDLNCNTNYAKTVSANVGYLSISLNENSLLVFHGGAGTSNPVTAVGLNPQNGNQLWSTQLPLSGTSSHFVDTPAAFSPDGNTAYFMTHLAGSGAWLNAIQVA